MYSTRSSSQISINLDGSLQICDKPSYKILWMYVRGGVEMFHADRRTGRHDEAKSRVSKF